MTKNEQILCRCIASLMDGVEPDWKAEGVSDEHRAEILRLVEAARE